MFSGEENFDKFLPSLMSTFNSTKQERLGLSPNEILQHPELDGTVFERKYAKKLRNVSDDVSRVKYKVNQLVRLVPFAGATPFSKVACCVTFIEITDSFFYYRRP